MSDENSTDIKHEGDPAFPVDVEQEKETQSESSPEIKPTETSSESSTEEQKPDEGTPFHEHPRFKELIEEKNALKRTVDELLPLKELATKFSPKEETNIPNWFGGDEAQWKSFQADQERLIEAAKSKAVAEIESKSQAERDRIKQANDWFESSIAEIESTGSKVDRNRLLKFVSDNQLVDTEGRWNYKKGFEFMSALEQAKADPSNLKAKKQLAASTTTESKAEDKPKDYVTSADLKKMGGVW